MTGLADVGGLDDGGRLALLERALLARRLEERMVALAKAGEMPATLHEGAGQEVCQLAALAATNADDPLLYAHRGIAYWLARDMGLVEILCDSGNKEGGTNAGRGNLMHIIDEGRGLVGQSGTLGGNLVIGVGVALAEQRLATGRVTLVFFGDGTANRGQFHEALNFAGLHQLPIVFFCENNGWGLSVPTAASTAVPDIAVRAAGYGFPGVVVDGNDPDAVHAAMATAVGRARRGEGPTLIEAKLVRLRPHFLGDGERYRDKSVAHVDPLAALQADLTARGLLDDHDLADLEADIAGRIEGAVAEYRAQPLAFSSRAAQGVFASVELG